MLGKEKIESRMKYYAVPGRFLNPFGGDGERICNGYVRLRPSDEFMEPFLVRRVVDL